MCPHAQHFDYIFVSNYFVDKAMLDIDAAGISSCKVAYQLFKGG